MPYLNQLALGSCVFDGSCSREVVFLVQGHTLELGSVRVLGRCPIKRVSEDTGQSDRLDLVECIMTRVL